jgi:hypothetical protein
MEGDGTEYRIRDVRIIEHSPCYTSKRAPAKVHASATLKTSMIASGKLAEP